MRLNKLKCKRNYSKLTSSYEQNIPYIYAIYISYIGSHSYFNELTSLTTDIFFNSLEMEGFKQTKKTTNKIENIRLRCIEIPQSIQNQFLHKFHLCTFAKQFVHLTQYQNVAGVCAYWFSYDSEIFFPFSHVCYAFNTGIY